jgi:glucose-6-phosphate 1-epimerase
MQALKERFEIPGIVRIEEGLGGFARIAVTSPLASAEIYLHGAHVTHYQPAGQQPVIWMSRQSWFQPGKPIRGGVPVCFPWFGPSKSNPKHPAHGFARLEEWRIDNVELQSDQSVQITLKLAADETTKLFWPVEFVARHVITIGQALTMNLQVQNCSPDPIKFEEALHTYFTVGDVSKISIEGLGGKKYIDKVDNASTKTQTDPLVRFTGETDRVYADDSSKCTIHDPTMNRRIDVSKRGSRSTVVWNPWINKAKAMQDFGDNEWPGMVCVETANVAETTVELNSGELHEMIAEVRAWPSK